MSDAGLPRGARLGAPAPTFTASYQRDIPPLQRPGALDVSTIFKLIIEDDEGKTTVYPLTDGEVSIGRKEGNTIRLMERNVSRRHARLIREKDEIYVEDLDSYNGVRINGERIVSRHRIREGDLVEVGDYHLALQRAEPEMGEALEETQPLDENDTQDTKEGEQGWPAGTVPDFRLPEELLADGQMPHVSSGARSSRDSSEARPEEPTSSSPDATPRSPWDRASDRPESSSPRASSRAGPGFEGALDRPEELLDDPGELDATGESDRPGLSELSELSEPSKPSDRPAAKERAPTDHEAADRDSVDGRAPPSSLPPSSLPPSSLPPFPAGSSALADELPTPRPVRRPELGGRPTMEIERGRALTQGPAPRSDMPRLICVSTQYAGREFMLDQSELVIGRIEDNDIVIEHRSVSRNHAKIHFDGRTHKIIDLQSANGILVNGEEYAMTNLRAGDLIELGHVRFRFVPAGETYEANDEEAREMRANGIEPPAQASAASAWTARKVPGSWGATVPDTVAPTSERRGTELTGGVERLAAPSSPPAFDPSTAATVTDAPRPPLQGTKGAAPSGGHNAAERDPERRHDRAADTRPDPRSFAPAAAPVERAGGEGTAGDWAGPPDGKGGYGSGSLVPAGGARAPFSSTPLYPDPPARAPGDGPTGSAGPALSRQHDVDTQDAFVLPGPSGARGAASSRYRNLMLALIAGLAALVVVLLFVLIGRGDATHDRKLEELYNQGNYAEVRSYYERHEDDFVDVRKAALLLGRAEARLESLDADGSTLRAAMGVGARPNVMLDMDPEPLAAAPSGESSPRPPGRAVPPAKWASDRSTEPEGAPSGSARLPPDAKPGGGSEALDRPRASSERVAKGEEGARAKRIAKLFRSGRDALFAGELAKAERNLTECVRRAPGYAPCHRSLGILYAHKSDHERAILHYRRYVELAPNAVDADRVREIIRAFETGENP